MLDAGKVTATPQAADLPAKPEPVLGGMELILGIGVLGLVSFVGVLDLTIVNVILPTIAATFSASSHEVTMGITCFAAAQAIATPLTGWLATRYGVVRIFMLSLICFAVTSLLCGLATNLPEFILARILQGFSAGPMLPIVQTLLQRSVPRHLIGTAFAFWAVVISAAPLVGPILGGEMADTFGWQWGFYINVPFLAVAIVVVWRVFGTRETPTFKVPLDVVGLLLLGVWVGALQFALDKGSDLDWLGSPLIVGLAITAVIGFTAFIIWELTDAHPLVDFSVLRYRSFLIGTPVSAISYSSLVVSNLLLTLWLQFGMGYTATWAGYAVGVMGVSSMLAGPVCALLTRRLDPRLVVSAFMTLSAAGFFWRSTYYGDVDFGRIALIQLCTGLTTTGAMGPIFAMVMGEIPHAKLPGAAGLLTFIRMLLVGVLTALMSTGWTYGQTRAHSDMVGTMNLGSRGLDAFMGDQGWTDSSLLLWNSIIDREAITISTQHMLVWTALLVLVAPVLIWFCPRPKSLKTTLASHE